MQSLNCSKLQTYISQYTFAVHTPAVSPPSACSASSPNQFHGDTGDYQSYQKHVTKDDNDTTQNDITWYNIPVTFPSAAPRMIYPVDGSIATLRNGWAII